MSAFMRDFKLLHTRVFKPVDYESDIQWNEALTKRFKEKIETQDFPNLLKAGLIYINIDFYKEVYIPEFVIRINKFLDRWMDSCFDYVLQVITVSTIELSILKEKKKIATRRLNFSNLIEDEFGIEMIVEVEKKLHLLEFQIEIKSITRTRQPLTCACSNANACQVGTCNGGSFSKNHIVYVRYSLHEDK